MQAFNENKEALPGYTGYIPHKFEMFGVTMGKISKVLVEKKEAPQLAINERTLYNSPHERNTLKNAAKRLYGFNSKYQKTWLGGPMNQIYQHNIPGYCGYVPGANSENLYGKTYANISKKSIYKNTEPQEFTALQRFKTTNLTIYKNPTCKKGG